MIIMFSFSFFQVPIWVISYTNGLKFAVHLHLACPYWLYFDLTGQVISLCLYM